MKCVLGIDVGTTACKVIAYDEFGNAVAKERAEYSVLHPQKGYAEIDPDSMWDGVVQSIYNIKINNDIQISAIAVSSHGEGVMPLNSEGVVIGNEILSYDTRTVNEAEVLRAQFGDDTIFDMSGQLLNSSGTICKIMWMKKNYHYGNDVYYMCAGDFVTMKLSGKRMIDYSLAARTVMLDVKKKQWHQALLEFVGIGETQLSELIQGGEIVGKIKEDVAQRLQLSLDTNIVAGGHDQACALLGSGVESLEEGEYSLGTTETIVCGMNQFNGDLYQYGLSCAPHVVENQYITMAGNFTGGNLLQWYRDNFAEDKDYNIIIEEMNANSTDILVLPHFTVTGSPWNDDKSCGMISGLTLATTRGEYIRALLEGVTYEILLNLENLHKSDIHIKHLKAAGGSCASQKIMQLKADMLGVPIEIVDGKEASCKGAALLAVGRLAFAREDEKYKVKKEIPRYIPNEENHRHYKENYVKYKKMYMMQKQVYMLE